MTQSNPAIESQHAKGKEASKKQVRPSLKSKSSRKCKHCGAEIELNVEFCPFCGKKLVDYCTFCGAPMDASDTVCEECGMPAEGTVCPKCGTFNVRSFCRKCNEPLTRAAARAIEKAKEDPKVQQMAARSMSIGVITGGLVQTLFQLPFVLKNNWKITFISLRKTFSNPGTKKVLKLIGPTIIGMAAYQLNDIVSSALATRTGAGVYSSLNYSLRLQELILGICAVTIGTVILPDLTGYAKKNDWENFNGMLTRAIRLMAFISIPITFYALCMDENLIKLVFSTGRFDESSAEMTVNVFRFHIIGLFFIAVNRVITPSFYAQLDSISPTIAGLINFTLNMILAFVLVKPMGGPGIALALTISSFFNTVALFLFLKKNKNINVRKTVVSTVLYSLRMVVFSVIASVPVILLRTKIIAAFDGHSRFISQGIPVLITALIFGAIGIALMAVTKDPLLKPILKKIRRR